MTTSGGASDSPAEFEHLAYHDPLTGLPNRLLLRDRLEVALARNARLERNVAVLFLDLDGFKAVNDRFGHEAGDHFLRGTSDRLRRLLRDVDTVARIGGDEFVIVLSDFRRLEDLTRLAERILRVVAEPMELDGHSICVTASLGVSLSPNDGLDGERLIRHADTAMYRAKEQGKNNFQLHTPELQGRAAERRRTEEDLSNAISWGGLELVYEPIVRVETGEAAGVEALVRWDRPGRVRMEPTELSSFAEDAGLSVPMEDWTLGRAEQDLGSRFEGSLRLSISPSQLGRRRGFARRLARFIADSGRAAARFEIEVRERAAGDRLDGCLAALDEIRNLGAKVSIGDFGVGRSSLSLLRAFPFDGICLDPSFIRDVAGRPRDAAMAKSLLRLGLAMNCQVAARGVETLDQLAFLRYHRCHVAQGPLFGSPLPAEEAAKIGGGSGTETG